MCIYLANYTSVAQNLGEERLDIVILPRFLNFPPFFTFKGSSLILFAILATVLLQTFSSRKDARKVEFISHCCFSDNRTRTLKTDSLDEKCPHNEIMYNMKLAGGLKAGRFTDIGRVKGINTCIKYCCDSKVDCDLAFMLGKRYLFS